MKIEKLTKWDKNNVERLAKIYDKFYAVKDSNYTPSPTVHFPRDQDILVEHGFTYCITSEVMYRRDKDGFYWNVSGERVKKSLKTVWYKHDEEYRRTRMHDDGMPLDLFKKLFPKHYVGQELSNEPLHKEKCNGL
jgi:hypothetical protein